MSEEKNTEDLLYIETKISTKDMFEFMMNHTYKSFMGAIGFFLCAMATVGLIFYWDAFNVTYKGILIVMLAFFILINPVQLYLRSKTQVAKAFKNNLCYTFTDEGIDIVQGDQSAKVNWADIKKVRSTRNLVIIYLSPIRAFIFPKNQIGENMQLFRKIVTAKAGCRKVVIK